MPRLQIKQTLASARTGVFRSPALNLLVHLFLLSLVRAGPLHGWASEAGQCAAILERRQQDRLTHVVMPLCERQIPLALRNLATWRKHPPCADSGRAAYQFVFWLPGTRNRQIERKLLADARRTSNVRSVQFQVLFAGLLPQEDTYLMGSRLQFERMLALFQKPPHNASHVFYMEPDCVPVRANWLAALDRSCRWPNPRFWVKGSIFRGNPDAIAIKRHYNLLHLNGNALYNVASQQFSAFYHQMVRPYIRRFWWEAAYDTDMAKYMLDRRNYPFSRELASHFQFTSLVANLYHTPYGLKGLLSAYPAVMLVHGGNGTALEAAQ